MGGVRYLCELVFHSLDWRSKELSSSTLISGDVVVKKFGELNRSARDKNPMYFPYKGIPWPRHGGLHIADMYKIKIIILIRYSMYEVIKLYQRWQDEEYQEGTIFGFGLAGLLRRHIDANDCWVGVLFSHFDGPDTSGRSHVQNSCLFRELNSG